jgi:DNA/RNA-binding domain of Phe-tRNA-synthetase-like protein
MKVTYDDALFDTIPGLCVGILAIRAVDNRGVNLEAEAFRRRCCTEANLLLKMNPAMADGEIKRYDDALAHLHMKGTTAISSLFKEYKKELGIEEEEEAKAGDDYEILSQPKAASLDELAGSDVLPRMNPVMDMVRGGMLKFHVDIHAFDMGDRKAPLTVHQKDGEWVVSLGDETAVRHWYCEDGTAGKVDENSENILILITGFAPNRKKVAATRNELARRMKSAFDRSVEVGWLEDGTHEFTASI